MFEKQMQATGSRDLRQRGRQRAMCVFGLCEPFEAPAGVWVPIGAVDVEDKHAFGHSDADVRVRVSAPPFFDLGAVGSSVEYAASAPYRRHLPGKGEHAKAVSC
jgi:hypothetical protein